jgi:hypothetical protein
MKKKVFSSSTQSGFSVQFLADSWDQAENICDELKLSKSQNKLGIVEVEYEAPDYVLDSYSGLGDYKF